MSHRTLHILALAALLATGGCAGPMEGFRTVFGAAGDRTADAKSMSLAAARADFAAQRFAQAARHFQAVVNADPRSIEALNGLAASFDQVGRYDVAERFYLQALGLDRGAPQTLNNLGYSYYLQGRHDLAVAFLAEATLRSQGETAMARNLIHAERALTGGQFPASAAPPAAAPPSPIKLEPVATRPPRALLPEMPDLTAPAVAPRRDAAAIGVRLPIIVANGAGRPGMATRVNRHLTALGIGADRVANARPYATRQTTIIHHPDDRATAEMLRRALPVGVRMVEGNRRDARIRVELGTDLLDFDASLLNAARGGTANEIQR
jgi:LytR cell envelope-related transcriptional attenuator/Tetratricopeptide repeat